ncbi:MAG: CocE/NonD family hydrolase [Vicinamibacterales bacterium]
MSAPRRTAAIAGLACVAALATGPRPVGQAAGAVERDVAVPMRDGVVLRADVARPEGAGPFPTLVYRTPYGKDEVSSSAIVRKAVQRGYAVVVQDVRGRHASDGEFLPYQQEGRDGFDTIEWAAAQPWSNGRIGTFGLSYPGAVQWLAALESPPHLVAMVPAMTFATPNHFWYTNGVWDGSWLAWTWLNIAPDLRRRRNVPGPRTDEEAEASWKTAGVAARGALPLGDLAAFKGVADWYYEWMRHPPYDPWWEWAELTGKYDRVSAAVLNLSGWHDEMYGPAGATMNFAGLVAARGGDARRARTQVVVGPWTHGTDLATTRIGEREMGPAASIDYDTLVLDWMDRWVKGAANGVDARPPVRFYVMGAGEWRTAESWPPPAERRALYLTGAPVPGRAVGRLAWEAPRRPATATFVADPAHPVRDRADGEAGAFNYLTLSARADVLAFDLNLPDEPLDLAGPMTAEIYVSVDRPDIDLWVKVLDNGFNVMSPGLDVLRASYRNRRPGRELLEAGRVYRLDLPTLVTANRFERRLRVLLMASFAPHMSRNLQTGRLEFDSAETTRARITVHMGGEHASRLVVPVATPTASR